MHILLIRHGQSTGNAVGRIQGWNEEPLTELGRAQALALGKRLQGEHDADVIYASPLLRARETAEIIGGVLGLDITFDERLKEHNMGVVVGLRFEEVEAQYPEVVKQWRESPWGVTIPGAEKNDAFHSRVMAAMDHIVSRHEDDQTVVVIAHGGVLAMYLTALVALDVRRRPPWVFDNASLSIVLLGGAHPRIGLLNDTCHLNHLQV